MRQNPLDSLLQNGGTDLKIVLIQYKIQEPVLRGKALRDLSCVHESRTYIPGFGLLWNHFVCIRECVYGEMGIRTSITTPVLS